MAGKLPHNVQRIDHIVFIVRPEHADEAAADFERLLGIEFAERYEPAGMGVRIYLDLSAGIEIITPLDPTIAKEYAAHVDRHGEGLFRLVFGVADLESTLDRVRSLGNTVHHRYDVLKLRPDWSSSFARFDESVIDPVHGVNLNLAQIEPR